MQLTRNNLIKSALGFGLVLTLMGCSLQPQMPREITVSAKPVEKPQLTLPPVDQLNMRPVDWVIITEENLEQKLTELRGTGQPIAIFGINGEGYENLGLNFSDIRAMVQQQQAIILAYENYYKQAEDALDGAMKPE